MKKRGLQCMVISSPADAGTCFPPSCVPVDSISICKTIRLSLIFTLKCACPCAPLSRASATVPATSSVSLSAPCLYSFYYLRRGILERNSKRLDQITGAGSHSWPQGKSICLWARYLGKHECGGGFTNPGLRRTEGKGRTEANVALAIDESKDREDS